MEEIEKVGSLMTFSTLPIEEIRSSFTKEQLEYIESLTKNDEFDIFIHRAGTATDMEEEFFTKGLAINPMYDTENIEFTASNCGNNIDVLLDQIIGSASYKGTQDVYILKIPKCGIEYRKGKSVPILYTLKGQQGGNSTYVNPEYIKATIKLPRENDSEIKIIKREDVIGKLSVPPIDESQKKYDPSLKIEFEKQNQEEIKEECKNIVKFLKEKFRQCKWPRKISIEELRSLNPYKINTYFFKESKKRTKNKLMKNLSLVGSDVYDMLISLLKDEKGDLDLEKYKNKDKNDSLFGHINYLHLFSNIEEKHKGILEQYNISYMDFIDVPNEEAAKAILGLEQVQRELGEKDIRDFVIKRMLDRERQAHLPAVRTTWSEKFKKIFSKKNKKEPDASIYDITETTRNSKRAEFLRVNKTTFNGEIDTSKFNTQETTSKQINTRND